MTHVQGWSAGEGGHATVKTKQGDDGRWHFLVTDNAGTVLARSPADELATDEAARDHGEKLVGGYWGSPTRPPHEPAHNVPGRYGR